MNPIFRQWIKNYNSFSKGDRIAILILGALIFLSIIANIIVRNLKSDSEYNYAEYQRFINSIDKKSGDELSEMKKLFIFDPNTITQSGLDSLNLPEYIKRNMLNYRKVGGKFLSTADVRKIYGMTDSIFGEIEAFIIIPEKQQKLIAEINEERVEVRKITGTINPNIASINELTEFGFNKFQAGNIAGYRSKGGIFKKPSDLLKIYGIDSVFFAAIENNIQIEIIEESIIPAGKTAKPDPIIVELNSADTFNLQQLNGIGAVYASRILKYRERLGGFYSTSQLLEVYNFPAETFRDIESNIKVDTLKIKKIRLNFADFSEMIKHPYLNKKQVEAVLKYRDKKGAFKNVGQLNTEGLIDSETLRRISPYLTCR